MLWGGRFGSGPDDLMMRLTTSIAVDIRLLEQDLAATKAHGHVLVSAGLLDDVALSEVEETCDALLAEWRAGTLSPASTDEDVHSLVERELTERLGETGARIHAGRSRNDLVATDLRLWCRDRSAELVRHAAELIEVLARRALEHKDSVMPGYTHLQRAQPVSLGFHLLAHGWGLLRDARRFEAARAAADESALGAGALAGTTLPLDPDVAARELGFAGVFDNAMDAVAQRDFACDLLYAAAVCGVHLSRLAEEIVLWSSTEFAFIRLPDEWSTGSSMMPQKRNPDLAELVRGRSAAGIGDLTAMLALLKGLPLAYDRDLQEDKELVFGAADRIAGCLEGMARMIAALDFSVERLGATAGAGTWATDLAEALVARGVPFRAAHEATGRLVASLEERGMNLSAADEAFLKQHHSSFEAADLDLADPRVGMTARSGPGGTAPHLVAVQARALVEGAAAVVAGARAPSNEL
jgi:argininosuccinate lyase